MAKILLAEDDAHTIRVMQLWLARHKHVVIESNNGREALDRLRSMSVDLLISDVNMPVMGGLELVRAVRRELGLGVPILMFSSRCDHADLADQVRDLSVNLYPKPFVPSKLVQRIEELIAGNASAGERGAPVESASCGCAAVAVQPGGACGNSCAPGKGDATA